MAAVGCMAICGDRQVQSDAITGLRTRRRPLGVGGVVETMAAKLT